MVSPWQWFRDRYPEGAVVTQLIGIHAHQFLVRVELRQEASPDRILVTALAAAEQLETAEDLALQRAWALLGQDFEGGGAMPTHTPAIAPLPAVDDSDELPWPDDPDGTPGPGEAPTDPSLGDRRDRPTENPWDAAPVQAAEATNGPTSVLKTTKLKSQKPKSQKSSHPQPSPRPAEPVSGSPDRSPEASRPTGSASVGPDPEAPSSQSPPPLSDAALPPPVDLSDVIAQTEVELRRLGWTQEQGREHLKATYGKLSRHHLSDEELLEFLLYLETLPNPGGPS
jgi:hypothetical protein